ncbi:MAG TPA: PRC-barrel domain-containing protein [Chloroflexota bacterium]|nr:PRC-barrel domain-containing protein [Chloroflexota bacterium]
MDIKLGMHVYTSDDKDIGTVDRLILDPERGTVKAAVVRKGLLLHDDVEVPAEMMVARSRGDARIAYTAAEVDRLPRFDEGSYISPPPDYLPPMGYPSTSIYWPVGYGVGAAPFDMQPAPGMAAPWTGDTEVDHEIGAALRRQDLENAVIGEGSAVLGRDGEKVGTVHELTFDPATSRLTGLVVHKGILMGKDTELPASLIDTVDDGVVYLKVDAREAVG